MFKKPVIEAPAVNIRVMVVKLGLRPKGVKVRFVV